MTCHFSTIFFWRCVPPFAQSTFMSFFSGTGTESVVDNIVKDIESSWKEIIYMCLVALGETIWSFNFTIILMKWNSTLVRYIYCYLMIAYMKKLLSMHLGLSLIMIVLLRFLAGVIVYIIMISIALACIIAPVILW